MLTLTCPADVIARKSRETQVRFFSENAARIADRARPFAAAFDKEARRFVMGNGGSACDAQHAAVGFRHPAVEKRPPLPTLWMTAEKAFLTVLANDADCSLASSQALRQLARPGNIAMGFSTSGKSTSVNHSYTGKGELLEAWHVPMFGAAGNPHG